MGYDYYYTKGSTTQIIADGAREGLFEEAGKKYGLELDEIIGVAKIEKLRVYLTARMSIYLNSCYGINKLDEFEIHEKDAKNMDEHIKNYREWRLNGA